jgi:hypothetical protein
MALMVAAFIVVMKQQVALADLHRANEALRRELATRETAPEPKPATASAAPSAEQSRMDRGELLRLRSEVTQLREQLATLRAGVREVMPSSRAAPAVVLAQSSGGEISQLASAAAAGDLGALAKLAEWAATARIRRQTNQTDQVSQISAELRAAFLTIGEEAGRGNETALQALFKASRMKELSGIAVAALGQAAGLGNQQALEPLLAPESYNILRSTAVSALRPAAEAGNPQAIQALANVAFDSKAQPLWYLTAQGLAGAAKAGSPVAIQALEALSRSENQSVHGAAFGGLEAAALTQPLAAEALRRLSGQ